MGKNDVCQQRARAILFDRSAGIAWLPGEDEMSVGMV